MPITPVISFNTRAASAGDYFNHSNADIPYLISEAGKTSINTGQTSEETNFYMSHNHDDEITDISFYISPSTAPTHATITSSISGDFSITTGVNDTLKMTLDNRTTDYTITFDSGTQTASNICDSINETIGELIAEVEDSAFVKLTSPSRGIASKIYIRSTGSTSLATLGLSGDDSNAVATGTTGNWGQLGVGCQGYSQAQTQVSYPFNIDGSTNTFEMSLDFDSYVTITLSASAISDDEDFEDVINEGLVNAGFSTTTDVVATVDDGILTIKSISTEDNSSVRVSPGETNDATTVIGMDNPDERLSDYANINATADYNELIDWGNDGYGMELSVDAGSTWTRIVSGTGDILANSIALEDGDGTTTADLKEFDYAGGDTDGEANIVIRITPPPDEMETGYREIALTAQFTYI